MSNGTLENRLALPKVLQQVHRLAVVTSLHELGYEVPAWDPDLIAGLKVADKPDDLVLGDLEFEDDFHHMSITGSPYFRLKSSWTPMRYLNQTIYSETSDDKTTYMQHVVKDVDSPLKIIDVYLARTADAKTDRKSDMATIFTSPDSPPLAIHRDDLHYVVQSSNLEYDDLRIINGVEAAFGQEAIHYLGERACGVIIGALRSARSFSAKTTDF